MTEREITGKDRRRARFCAWCPVCRRARRKQRGLFFWLVKHVESRICPWCRAYARVYGREAYERTPEGGGGVPGSA